MSTRRSKTIAWGALASVLCSSITAYGTWEVARVSGDQQGQERYERLLAENAALKQDNQNLRIATMEKKLEKIEAWQVATTERQDQRQADTNKALSEINTTLATLALRLEQITKEKR